MCEKGGGGARREEAEEFIYILSIGHFYYRLLWNLFSSGSSVRLAKTEVITIYDLQHPGSSELIEEYAGKDATAEFDDFGHSSDAKRILKGYLIGELEDVSAHFKVD